MRIGQIGKSHIILFFGIMLILNFIAGYAQAATPTAENESDCISCHNLDNSVPSDNTLINHIASEKQDISIVKTTGTLINGLSGSSDCISCHDIGATGSNKHIDAYAIKQGVHGNLNNATVNITILSDPVNKACWACHGNGTEPSTDHPLNYATPYSCQDCHNGTSNLSFTNSSIINNITTRKVFEHIQPPYFEQINSTIINSNANCQGCHDKSKVTFLDSGFSLASNVSHYASRTGLVSPAINCSLCHKDIQNASAYWANTTRHPARSQDDAFCDNCHNTSSALDLHSQPLVKPRDIHTGFDWQNDDNSEINPSGTNEACMSCHGTHYTVYKLCENCHVSNMGGPVLGYFTRPDINETIPVVYAHTNFSDTVNVPNQSTVYSPSQKAKTFSSCYSFNNVTLEGTCHGNSYKNISASGGFYAFKQISNDIRSTPYHFTKTIDRMPETTNCVFCHNQTNGIIRKAWGNATQLNSGKHEWYKDNDNSKCWSCHVTTGNAPIDFHSNSVTGGGGSDCISCHSPGDANTSKFARHANINTSDGPGIVSNFDCWTCHYKQNMDRSKVYLCESCHINSTGIVPITNASLIMGDFMHGMTTCKVCHAPTSYHLKGAVGPLGLVEIILKK